MQIETHDALSYLFSILRDTNVLGTGGLTSYVILEESNTHLLGH